MARGEQYGSAVLSSLRAKRDLDEQERLKAQANQPSFLGGLAGGVMGALSKGKGFTPEAFLSPEAALGAASGYLQPSSQTGNGIQDVVQGGVAGYKAGSELQANQRELAEKEAARPIEQFGKFAGIMKDIKPRTLTPEEEIGYAKTGQLPPGVVYYPYQGSNFWEGRQGVAEQLLTLILNNPNMAKNFGGSR